jgi:hypothetical protein
VPLNPGALTITFNPPGRFVEDRLHTKPASSGLSAFSQPGCTLQSATVKDKVDDTAYAEATDKIVTPYNTNTAGVEAEWYAVYGGNSYRILGFRNAPDGWGRFFHCEFIVKNESG